MRYGKITVCILTLIFLAVAIFFGINELSWEDFPFTVVLSSDGEAEEISCWKNLSNYYVFLPSYAETADAAIRANKIYEIKIDGQPVTNGMSCECFPLNTPLALSYSARDGEHNCTITFVQSGNAATMYIDVPSGSMEYIHEKKGNAEAGTVRLYTAEGDLTHKGNLESIKGRGNSTWEESEKKPYSLTLSAEADLLGMGQAQEWILLANAYDPSHLRNKVSYDFAYAVGLQYSPQCQWVDLYLNGEYAGLYLLSERNEVHPQRVAISQEHSFLISKEMEWKLQAQESPYILSQNGYALRIHDASMTTTELEQIWQSAENAILAEDGIDPATGKPWTELIDLDSWVKKYLIEEVFGNTDGGFMSQFFYYDGSNPSGKIYAGPVWDMDNSLAGTVWQTQSPYSFCANRPYHWNRTEPAFFHALYQKEEFYQRLTVLYERDFQPLLTELLNGKLDQYVSQISRAAAMNRIRWNVDDFAEETEAIQTYLDARAAFLNALWVEGAEYCTVQIDDGSGISACIAVRPGELLPELPNYENTEDTVYDGWYTSDTEEPFDITQPICEDTSIYLKRAG